MFDLIERWRGFEILRRKPGFEFTPVLLGKVTSYVVFGESGSASVFAFMYRFRALQRDAEPDEVMLADMAVDLIKRAVNASEPMVGVDRTFELDDGRWREVERPAWWIPYFS